MSGLFDQITNYSPPLLTTGQVNYKGTWDAAANSPTLTSPPAAISKGDYYVVNAAGTQFTISFAVGDWIISNGTAWEKVDLTDAVSSVFGRTGAVVGVSTDYSAVGITNTAIGASSPSTGAFTTITATSTITATGAVTGSNLSGTNTGNQTISITGDVTAAGSTGVLTASVTKINGTSLAGLSTGILKNTTTTGVPSIAVAADFPTLNQNTTGSAATLTTSRSIHGGSFNGSADVTNIIASTYGGTGNGFTKFSGPTTAEKTFTLPDSSATLLYSGGALGTPASGTVTNLTGTASININGTVGATTPSTGAFTTLSATGDITASGGNILNTSGGSFPIRVSGATTTATAARFTNTGGDTYFGAEGTATNNLIVGCTAYDTIVRGPSGIAFSANAGNNMQMRLSSTGLAVTGALSTTGNITLNNVGRGILVNYTGPTGSAFTSTDDTSGSQFVVFTASSGTTIGSISRVTTTSAVTFNTTSDGRLKENLRDFTDSGRLIDSLKPRVFDWKNSDDNGKNVIGFIAQEEHAADPIFAHIGAVSVGDEDPETITKQWQRSDSALIPILVAELKTLRQRVAALESN